MPEMQETIRGNNSLLGEIGSYTEHMAKTLSATLDTDILIIDTNMQIVGSAFKYLNLYTDIHVGTLISTIILENRNLIVEDKKYMSGCRKCSQFRECKMSSFVGVPIRYEDQVVGAMALILTKHRAKFMFESLDSTVSFLENFAKLLSAKIEEETRTIGLENRLKEVENIMDKLFEAVVYTDYYGNIVHVNKRFCDVLHFDRKLIGQNIREVFPYQTIRNYFTDYQDITNEHLTFERDKHLFHGVISSEKIYLSRTEFGTLFHFRSQYDFVKRINISEQGSLVTFAWLKSYFPEEKLKEIEKQAKTDRHLLIQGPDIDAGLLLAKAVFNASKRNLHDLYVIYADNLYRELFRIYMLDDYGILQNADQATVVIVRPERLPLYIQNALAEFITNKKLKLTNRTVRTNVRFLFCTNSELAMLAEQGLFSEKLYLCLAGNEIRFGSLVSEKAGFRQYFMSGIHYYKEIYGNKNLDVSGEVTEFFRSNYGTLGMHYIETMIEKIAAECSGKVTLGMLEQIETSGGESGDFCKLEEVTRKQVKDMLEKGYSKNKIASVLGISRSTLYRKIKEYGL